MPPHTSPKNAQCSSCALDRLELRCLHRHNERRVNAGRPPDLEGIRKVKAHMSECAAGGHHDPQASANARWRRDVVATSP